MGTLRLAALLALAGVAHAQVTSVPPAIVSEAERNLATAVDLMRTRYADRCRVFDVSDNGVSPRGAVIDEGIHERSLRAESDTAQFVQSLETYFTSGVFPGFHDGRPRAELRLTYGMEIGAMSPLYSSGGASTLHASVDHTSERDSFCYYNGSTRANLYNYAIHPSIVIGDGEIPGHCTIYVERSSALMRAAYDSALRSHGIGVTAPLISERAGPLGELGGDRGICSGMALITAAAHSNARFECAGTPLSEEAFRARMEQALDSYRSGSTTRYIFPGMCGLFQGCLRYSETMLDMAIARNLENAISARVWTDFFAMGSFGSDPTGSSGTVDSCGGDIVVQRRNGDLLRRVYAAMQAGRTPTILIHADHRNLLDNDIPHAVVVTGMNVIHDGDGTLRVELVGYDPNYPLAATNSLALFRGVATDYSVASSNDAVSLLY